jgi:sodium-coupled neutral amino acid transporter 11
VLGALLATAFTAHPNAAIFMRGLKDPSQWGKVVHAAFGVAAVMYTATMLAGFRTFGMNSQSVLLNNYASADPMAILARLATVVSLVGAYPLLFKGLLQAFESLIADANQFPAVLRSRNSVYLLFGLSTLISVGIRDLTLLGGLIGSLAGSAVVYLLPGYLWLGHTRLQKGAAAQGDRAMAWALVALGWVLTIGGTTVTVLQGFTDLLH